jgi:predicted metalloprotease with PDZ domain
LWVALAALPACIETMPARRLPESFGTRIFEPVPIRVPGEAGFLGLRVEANQSESLDDLEFFPGVRVVDVVENSPAARAGLRIQDVILAIDSTPTNDREGFDALVASLEPGREVELEVQRGSEVFRQKLLVASRAKSGPPPEALYHVERIKVRAKIRTTVLETEEGLAADGSRRGAAEIVELLDESPLAALGLGPGDLVLEVDGREVESAADFVARIHASKPGSRIELTFQHQGLVQTDRVELWSPPRRLKRLHIPLIFTYEADPDPGSDAVRVEFLDLYLFSLFRYKRDGLETSYTLLSLFSLSFGSGELVEIPSRNEGER